MIEWYLETATDPEVTSNHVINEFREYFIGRKRGLDIITTNPLVSRNHGVITLRPDNSIYIKDTNSSNGIWINNIKIARNSDYLLQKGDLIGIGGPTTATERPELYRLYYREICSNDKKNENDQQISNKEENDKPVESNSSKESNKENNQIINDNNKQNTENNITTTTIRTDCNKNTSNSKSKSPTLKNENNKENCEKPVSNQTNSSPDVKPNINDLASSNEAENISAIEIIDSSDEETNIKREKPEIKKEPDHSFTQDHDEDIIEINSDDEDMFPKSQLFDDVVKTEPSEENANDVVDETIEKDSIIDADADQNDDSIFANIKKEEVNTDPIDEFIDDEDDEDGDEDDCRVWIQKLSQQQDIISCSQEFDRLKKSNQDDDEEEQEAAAAAAAQQDEEEDNFPKFDDIELELDKSEDESDGKQIKKSDVEKSDDEEKEERRVLRNEKWREKPKKKDAKKTYVKPPVIEAPYLLKGKRRATDEPKITNETKNKKRKPDEEQLPQPSTSATISSTNLSAVNNTSLVVDKSVREEFKKRHKQRRKSVDSMSRDEKQQIAEERKKKLKELAEKHQEQRKDEKVPKISAKPKVKVSNSRGLFLTDGEQHADQHKVETEKKTTKEKKKHGNENKKKENYKRQSSIDEKPKKKYKIPKIEEAASTSANKSKSKKEETKKQPSRSKSIDKVDEITSVKIANSNKSNKIVRQDSETTKTKAALRSILKGSEYVKKTFNVQFNDKIETKIFERDEAQMEPILTVNKSQENNATIVNDILVKILNWLPIWLQEQKKVECCPPNLTERPPLKMFYHFNTAKDYYSIVTPLMLMELWRSIFKDWCNIRNPTILGSVDDVGDVPHMSNNIYLYCHSLTIQGNPDIYINRGDLAIVEIMLNSDRVSSNGSVGVATKFGYVKDVLKKRLTKSDRFNGNLITKTQIPEYKITYTILIRKFAESLCDRRLIRVRIVSRIDPPLRLFRSVSFLEKSSLCNFILKPAIKDYKIAKQTNMQLALKDIPNNEQLMCVYEACQICTRDEPGIYLIQGPPGTGKSFVIKNIIRQLIYGENNRKKVRILMCAPSNGAVDEIACRLLDMRGTFAKTERFKMIRLGPPNSITNPLVRNISVPELIRKQMLTEQIHNINSNSLMAEQYNSLLSKINKIEHKVASMKQRGENTMEEEMKLKKAQDDLIRFKSTDRSFQEKRKQERYLEEYYIENADIICSTLSSCMSYRMEELYRENKIKLDCCIIDEATQSNEQENLIPLMLGINKFILVGDPQQLPPTILSQEAKNLGYGNSLFYRIQHNLEHLPENPIRMLTEQYRMHPEICQFPSEKFYGGKLKTSESVVRKCDNILYPYRLFSFRSQIDNNESDYLNKSEANLVVLLSNIIMKKSKYNIGIITPYSRQKDLLINLFKNMRNGNKDEANSSRVIINTVDGFQGQERDVIIISCCRIKLNGFLSDFQRLNVALTRAKHATYICAHAHLFENDSVWKQIEINAQKRNMLFYLNDSDATQEQYMTSLICQ